MIELNLFGNPLIKISHQQPLQNCSERELVLVAYLACQDAPNSRSQISNLMWTGRTPSQARSNLRTFLTRHRENLEELLIIGRDRIGFKAAESWIDATEFTNRIQSAKRFAQRELKPSAKTAERYRKALRLYKGPFLEGIELNEDSDIAEWLDQQRDYFEQEMLLASEYLIQFSISIKQFEDGFHLCENVLNHDYFNEKIQAYAIDCLAHTRSSKEVQSYFEAYTSRLKANINVPPGKELSDAVQRILNGGTPNIAPPQSDGTARVNSLPSSPLPTRPLIGRQQEATLIKKKLIQSSQRLVTLVGIGGIGKTHLALHVAEEIAGEFLDGVLFVSLSDKPQREQASHHSEPHIIETLATGELNLALDGRRGTAEQLFAYLRERDMLILIDNAETNLDNVEQFAADLLNHVPNAKLLVTSRTPLNLRAELVVILKNLSIPAEAAEVDLHTLSAGSFDSVRLFDSCAKLVFDQFEINADNLPSIIRICHLVSGIPLAIELAATWIGHYSCAEIVEAIEHDFSFLSTRFGDYPERHTNMSQVFNHSWQLLSKEEQSALLQLSIFPGSFSRDAAEKLIGSSMGTLISLVDKSMLNISHSGRYDMHALVRRFVVEKWDDYFESKGKQKRLETKIKFGRYFLEMVSILANKLHVEEPASTIKTIQLELSNILHAWDGVIEAQRFDLLIGAINSLSRFYHFTGLYHEALTLFSESAKRLELLTSQISPDLQHSFMGVMARLQAKVAFYHLRLRQFDRGKLSAEKAVEYGKLANDPTILAEAHLNLGEANRYSNQIELAEHSFEMGLALAREGANKRLESATLRQMGRLAWRHGEIDEADRYYWQALVIERQRGDLLAQAQLVVALAQNAEIRGNLSLAQSYYEEGIENCLKLTNNHRLTEIRLFLGRVFYLQGSSEQAKAIFKLTLAESKEAGDVYSEGESYRGLAIVYALEQELEEAKKGAEKAFRLAQQHQDQHYHTLSMGTLGTIYQKIGQTEEAERMLKEALNLSQRLKFKKNISDILIGLSLCELDRDNISAGLAYAERALNASVGMVQKAIALVYLGNALWHAKQVSRGYETDKKALALIRQIGVPRLEKILVERLEKSAEQVETVKLLDPEGHSFLRQN